MNDDEPAVDVNPNLRKYLYTKPIRIDARISRFLKEQKEIFCVNDEQRHWEAIEIFYLLEGGMDRDLVLHITDARDISNKRHPGGVELTPLELIRVSQKKFEVATYHVHPSGSVIASPSDIFTFVNTDLIAGHGLVHIIDTPQGALRKYNLGNCYTPQFFELRKDFGIVI